MFGNGSTGSASITESRFTAALLRIILLSKVDVAIIDNIQNLDAFALRGRACGGGFLATKLKLLRRFSPFLALVL